MAGLALLLKQQHPLTTTTTIVSKGLHSFSTLNALAATIAASSTVSFLGPSSSPSLFAHFNANARDWRGHNADAALVDANSWEEEETMCHLIRTNKYPIGKNYNIELKPLFAAFQSKALGATTIRVVLANFSRLLIAYLQLEDDSPARPSVDVVVPLIKQSFAHIMHEVSVTTTRGILERVAVRYVTNRMAWKLLKDISMSAIRKAGRELSPAKMFAAICKTTLQAHALGIMANWMVQLSIDFYISVHVLCKARLKEGKQVGLDSQELKRLARRTVGNTLKGSVSLVLASVGAGLGTVLIKPSTGTLIGCAAGNFVGYLLVDPLVKHLDCIWHLHARWTRQWTVTSRESMYSLKITCN